jgi:hypothetical protein
MGAHDIDLVHGIDLARGTGTQSVNRNQTARRATGGV